ncbi:hypothetical protein R6Q57_020834, partial [Mikania cordata]
MVHDIPPIFAFQIKDLLEIATIHKGDNTKKHLIHAVIIIGVWCIWKTRNEVIFNGSTPSIGRIVEEVKSMGFLWIKNRSKYHALDWDRWKCFQFHG